MAKSMLICGKEPSVFTSYLVGDCIKSDVKRAIAYFKASTDDKRIDARVEVIRYLGKLIGYVYGLCAAYNNCECFEASKYWSRYSERLNRLLIKCLDF